MSVVIKNFLKAVLIFIIGYPFSALSLLAQQENWEKVKEVSGIAVYTRPVEGSSYEAFKAITEINTTLEKAEQALRSIDTYDEWYHNIKEGKKIEEIDAQSGYCYVQIDLPWPVTDRDNIFKYIWSENKETGALTLTSTAAPDYLPLKEGYTRIQSTKSIWRITPRGDNTIELYHEAHAEPGGNLPGWIVNSFLTEGPLKSLQNLKQRLEQS